MMFMGIFLLFFRVFESKRLLDSAGAWFFLVFQRPFLPSPKIFLPF